MEFLEELRWRGLLAQVTDEVTAKAALAEPNCGVYIGFDPTADSLHVGSLLQITLLMRLGIAGHRPIALVGGGTGMIGDPSGKSAERKLQTDDEVRANAQAIEDQILSVWRNMGAAVGHDRDPQFANNATWLNNLNVIEFLRDIGKHFSVNAMVQRDSVKTRLEAREQGISYTEFSYMLLQAYDFLELYRRHDCRAQFGGSDQWGNIVSGTDLIGRLVEGAAEKSAFGVTVPLITAKNGQKFGKTETGTIWLDPQRTSPYQFYQFWMNVDDADVLNYLKYFTFGIADEIEEIAVLHGTEPHKRLAQRALAVRLTLYVHGQEACDNAQHASAILFGADPYSAPLGVFAMLAQELPSFTVGPDATVLDVLVGENRPFQSNGEAKRAIQAASVAINGAKIGIEQLASRPDSIGGRYALIRHGKKSYFLADFGA
jgi:tyrosyl-tRNA synthetase